MALFITRKLVISVKEYSASSFLATAPTLERGELWLSGRLWYRTPILVSLNAVAGENSGCHSSVPFCVLSPLAHLRRGGSGPALYTTSHKRLNVYTEGISTQIRIHHAHTLLHLHALSYPHIIEHTSTPLFVFYSVTVFSPPHRHHHQNENWDQLALVFVLQNKNSKSDGKYLI